MTRTLLLTGLRDLVRRPLHTGLMVLGVALGVAVVIAIDLANTSAKRGFQRSTEAVTGRATHHVLGGPLGLPQDVFRRIRVEAGLRASTPVVEGHAVALDLDRQPLHVLGLDPLSDAPFRDHLGGGSLAEPGFARVFVDPRAAVIGSALAARYGLALGSPLRLQVQDRIETLEVAGIAHAATTEEEEALESVVLLDVGAAQRLFRLGDRVSRVDLIASADDLARVTPLLPPGARVAPASEQSSTVGQLTDAFQLNLTALSLLALVVGMFLIYNTVMFSVVQRRAVIGTLRLLGATGNRSSRSSCSRRRRPRPSARSSASASAGCSARGPSASSRRRSTTSTTCSPSPARRSLRSRWRRRWLWGSGRGSSRPSRPLWRPPASSRSRRCAAAPSKDARADCCPASAPRALSSRRSGACCSSFRTGR